MRPSPRRREPSRPAGPLLGLAAALVAAAACPAQTLEDLRRQLSEDLREVHFAQSMMGLVLLSRELELTGAKYSIDNEEDTDLTVYALPFHHTRALWGTAQPSLYLEGTLGYGEARESLADLYQGGIPGLETSVSTKWRAYGALLGVGLEFPVAKDLTVTPIVDVGVGRIENDTNYGGPGAGVTAALADGIAFNWEALTTTYGGAGRVDWRHALGERHRLEVVGRYDMRWTETFDEDDAAQDFAARSQLVTLRGDLIGPTGLTWFDKPVEWQLSAAYRAFPEGTLFGVEDYMQVGASLLVPTGDYLPIGQGLTISAAYMFAEDFEGWTIGCGLMF